MGSRPAPDERRGGGDRNEGFSDIGELLVVAGKPAVLDDPGEGPLNYPAAPQHLKALGSRMAFDDLDDDMGPLPGPMHQPTGVAAIGKGAFNERVLRA